VKPTNPKATQQPDEKKKQRKKGKGDKKPTNNAGEGHTEKKKSKYPCNICKKYHLTHQCPRLAKAQKLLAQQQPAVLTNLFLHGKNLSQASSSAEGASQGPPPSSNNPSSANVYMMKGSIDIMTRTYDYGIPNTFEKGKEAKNPNLPLQIEKMLGKKMTHIPKGAFKKYSHNPNERASQYYSVVEDLSQTPCAMSTLEVLQSFPSQRKDLLATLGSV
jgi:hypothetical protein